MESILIPKILTVFGAGLLTSLSPCVYPMIPISLGYFGTQAESGTRLNVVLFFIGQLFTFTILGVLAAFLGEIFGFSSQNPWIQIGIGTLLMLFGISSLLNFVPAFLQKTNNIQFKKNDNLLFPILLGAGTALLASPCTTPVLGAVLVAVSTSAHIVSGTIYMFFYALGATLIFLVLGLGLMNMKKMPKSGMWMKKIHKGSAILIIIASLFFLYQGGSFFFLEA